MNYNWIQFFVEGPVLLVLAWIIVIPIWASIVMTCAAILFLLLGVFLLIVDLREKKAREKRMKEYDEIIKGGVVK